MVAWFHKCEQNNMVIGSYSRGCSLVPGSRRKGKDEGKEGGREKYQGQDTPM